MFDTMRFFVDLKILREVSAQVRGLGSGQTGVQEYLNALIGITAYGFCEVRNIISINVGRDKLVRLPVPEIHETVQWTSGRLNLVVNLLA